MNTGILNLRTIFGQQRPTTVTPDVGPTLHGGRARGMRNPERLAQEAAS